MAQIFIKVKKFELAFKHLAFGVFTMDHPGYYAELAAAALKAGYAEKARQICTVVKARNKVSGEQLNKILAVEKLLGTDGGTGV
jgi:hypothetical protein